MSRRRGDDRLIQGTGQYLADISVPGTLSAAFVRSPFAHGRLIGADTTQAARLPGVHAIFTAEDLDLQAIPGNLMIPPVPEKMERPPLVVDTARYMGEPLAIVIADDQRIAVDAAEMVTIEMDELSPVVDLDHAASDTTLLFPDVGTNIALTKHTETGLTTSHPVVRVDLELSHPRLAPNPIETLGILSSFESGDLTVWCSHQSPHNLQRQLADLLDIRPENLRIRVPDVGGAFGQKGPLYPEYLAVVAASVHLKAPVRWLQSRRENISGGAQGRGARTRLSMTGDMSGKISELSLETLADAGAYPHHAALVPLSTHFMATGPYRFDRVRLSTSVVTTTTAPTGPYRGAGRPEATYALERALDAFAHEIGMDPAEVRRLNLLTPQDMPYTTATGAVYDGGDYHSTLDKLLETLDYAALREEQRRRRQSGEKPIGIGLSVFVDRAGGGKPDLDEYASVEIGDEGQLTVRTGSTDSGQGHATVWSRVAADIFRMSPEKVSVVAGDTSEVPAGTGTFGSRSSQAGAGAVFRAATEAREQALRWASEMLEIATHDLVSTSDGGFEVRGAPGYTVTLAEVVAAARSAGSRVFAEDSFTPGAHTFPNAAHGAAVRVDPETGEVRILNYVAIDDCGRILDPMIVAGQVHGSVAQGIGQALFEVVGYREDGELLTGTLADYAMPRASDVPFFSLAHSETPAPSNPLGTKGIGESGAIGAPAAVINAIVDALRPWGVSDIPLPALPASVWRAINSQSV